MKLSIPIALGLAAFAAASPTPALNNEIADPAAINKRCFLWWLFLKPKPKPQQPKPNPPAPKPTTPCPTTPTPAPTTATPTPTPEPTGPETKREDTTEDSVAQLFDFIDAANEDDVHQFIHFYKNADQGAIEAWWAGRPVDSEFAPSYPASRVHEIANSNANPST